MKTKKVAAYVTFQKPASSSAVEELARSNDLHVRNLFHVEAFEDQTFVGGFPGGDDLAVVMAEYRSAQRDMLLTTIGNLEAWLTDMEPGGAKVARERSLLIFQTRLENLDQNGVQVFGLEVEADGSRLDSVARRSDVMAVEPIESDTPETPMLPDGF
jgi:hypothetical protein